MSIHQRHFILLVVVIAIIACSSRLCLADRTVRDKTAVSLKNADDETPTSHTKSIDTKDEERGPSTLTKLGSLASTDSRLTSLLSKSKSISQSASKTSPWRRFFGKSQSKKMQQNIAQAEDILKKNPKVVKTVVSNPRVRKAANQYKTKQMVTERRNAFKRVLVTIFGEYRSDRYYLTIIGIIVVIILALTAVLIFGPQE